MSNTEYGLLFIILGEMILFIFVAYMFPGTITDITWISIILFDAYLFLKLSNK